MSWLKLEIDVSEELCRLEEGIINGYQKHWAAFEEEGKEVKEEELKEEEVEEVCLSDGIRPRLLSHSGQEFRSR